MRTFSVPHLTVSLSSSCSGDWPGSRSTSTMRRASWLKYTSSPVRASNTATTTGEVFTRVSSSLSED